MTFFKSFAIIGAVTSMSACNIADLIDEPSQEELAARAFISAVQTEGAFGSNGVEGVQIYRALQDLPVTRTAQLPTTAKVEYFGQIVLGNIATDGVVGDLALSASFIGKPSIGGGANNFVDRMNRDVGGVLTVTQVPGSINVNADPETEWQFSPMIGGTLTQVGRVRTVQAQLNGEFRGNTASYVAGEVSDTVLGGDNNGFFVAEDR